jgi:hypothetical protein
VASTTGELLGDKTIRVSDDGFVKLLEWAGALDAD